MMAVLFFEMCFNNAQRQGNFRPLDARLFLMRKYEAKASILNETEERPVIELFAAIQHREFHHRGDLDNLAA